MYKKKLLSIFIALMFMLTIAAVAVPQAEAAVTLTDINGHWAQTQIQNMVDKGVINGYPDGSFKPENSITRAEFMKTVNSAFGFTATASKSFSDVAATDWFAPEIAKAVAAGYISGYPDGTMKPNANISRQEAAIMIAKAAKLDTSTVGDLSKISDAAGIADWSKAYVAACVKANFIGGYPDGTFKAVNNIKRSEAAVIVANTMAAAVYDKAGTYGPATGDTTIKGNVVISAADVILQNTIITGDLTIAQSVGEGTVTLKNVTVKGTTYINGGGSHSVVADGSNLGNVVSNKPGVHISCVNGTTVVSVTLASGATVDVASGSTIEGVTVSTDGAVTLNGDFASVAVEGANTNVTVASGTVESITIDAAATNAAVNVASGAAVTNVTTSAAGSAINVASGATLTNLTADAATTVTGTGTITSAAINSTGVTIEQKPTTTTVASGVTSTVGGSTVSGTTTTTTTTTSGSGGGGNPTVAATAIAITVNGADVAGTVTGTSAAIDLHTKLDTDNVTAIKITAPSGSTLTLSSVNDITVNKVLTNLSSISPGSIMAGASSVSMGTLRSLFGNTLILNGTLACSGYDSSTVTLTITLSTTAAVDVSNNYVTVTSSGTTITATIKAGMGTTLLKNIGIRSVLVSKVGQIPTTVIVSSVSYDVADTASIQAAIATLTGSGKTWDNATLGGLAGKSIQFTTGDATTYTINFI